MEIIAKLFKQDLNRTFNLFAMERVTGIEPALSAWEAEVMPFHYTRIKC